MHKLEPILYVLIFLTLALLVEGVYLLITGSQRRANRTAADRLRSHAGALPADGLSDEGRSIMRENQKHRRGIVSRIPGFETLELFLYRAGMPMPVQFFVISTLALGAGGFFVGYSVLRDTMQGLMFTSLGFLPTVYVEIRRRQRMAAFDRQLPDAMELLCRSLRSGHGMRAGFQMVGDEMSDPVGTEFARVAEEISFGMDMRDALRNMGYRVNHSDMPFFINAVVIQRETGGNLAGILEQMARMVRERLRFFGKVKGLLAQIRMTANLLAVMPIGMALAVSAVNPDYMAPLFETPAGHMMIVFCVVMVTIGWLVCRRLGMVKY